MKKTIYNLMACSILFMPIMAVANSCEVLHVVDGGTLKCLLDDGRIETVKLSTIKAPDLNTTLGQESRRSLMDLSFNKSFKFVPLGKKKNGVIPVLIRDGGTDLASIQLARKLAYPTDVAIKSNINK